MRLPIRRFLQNYNKPLVLESSLQKIFHRFSAIIIRAKEQGGRDWKNRASPKPANSTPIVEPFINTSPSLTFPLTRLRKHTTVEQADGRQNGARLQERERESVWIARELLDRSLRIVIVPRSMEWKYFLAGTLAAACIRDFHEETISFAALTLDRIAC